MTDLDITMQHDPRCYASRYGVQKLIIDMPCTMAVDARATTPSEYGRHHLDLGG